MYRYFLIHSLEFNIKPELQKIEAFSILFILLKQNESICQCEYDRLMLTSEVMPQDMVFSLSEKCRSIVSNLGEERSRG